MLTNEDSSAGTESQGLCSPDCLCGMTLAPLRFPDLRCHHHMFPSQGQWQNVSEELTKAPMAPGQLLKEASSMLMG